MAHFDVIIVGGGINGVGIARDCTLRGMKTMLIEKHDFAKGASGNNTGMIHGGVRYLRYDVHTTKVSCQDSGYIQTIASHLISRIPFLFPVFKSDANAKLLLEGAEIFFEAYDVFQPLKRGKSHTRLTKEEAIRLEPALSPNIVGAVTLDEWGIDAFRLTLENALDAKNHGADVRTYCELNAFERDHNGTVIGVRFFDRIKREHETHHAPVVINATGAWGPKISAKAGVPYRLRQGKGVHVVLSHRVSNYGMIMQAVDGRQMFLVPHDTRMVIGTTDDDFYGDLDEPPILEDELRYIWESASRVMPGIERYRPMSTYVGVRPTVYEWGKDEDTLSREHVIIDHAADDAPGLLSVTGGKLAAYRQLAEEVSDLVALRVGNRNACVTHSELLPGARSPIRRNDDYQSSRLATRQGGRSVQVQALIEENPRYAAEVCLCESVTEAEIRHVCRTEMPRRLVDLRGRTKISKGACGGCHCMLRCAQIWAEERKLGQEEMIVELRELMNASAAERGSSFVAANWASEELTRAAYSLIAM